MVYAEKRALNDVFTCTIFENDRVLLKTILESIKCSRSSHLKELLKTKEEFSGFSALQFVCLQGNSVTASLLIDTGSTDVDEKGQYGWTALHAAAYSGDYRTVHILLNSCANSFARDENGNLPIDFSKHAEIRELLTQTMKCKNEDLYNELNEQYNYSTTNQNTYKRSRSCFPDVSLVKINELQNKIHRTNSYTCDDMYNLISSLRKWKTYANLTSENVLDLTC